MSESHDENNELVIKIYNELIMQAKRKSTIDYEHLGYLTNNLLTDEELDLILRHLAVEDLAIDRPELWVLVLENGKNLPRKSYFDFLFEQGLMNEHQRTKEIFEIQKEKAHSYWPKRKRSGRKFR